MHTIVCDAVAKKPAAGVSLGKYISRRSDEAFIIKLGFSQGFHYISAAAAKPVILAQLACDEPARVGDSIAVLRHHRFPFRSIAFYSKSIMPWRPVVSQYFTQISRLPWGQKYGMIKQAYNEKGEGDYAVYRISQVHHLPKGKKVAG